MTDEQFGRAWAKQQGIDKPRRSSESGFGFHYFVDDALFSRVDVAENNPPKMLWWYDTPELAYAALGKAVRAVHAAVPMLREECKQVTEQPPPTPNANESVWPLVIADMHARDQKGRAEYRVPLQAFNGRDALVDLYEELLDAVVYLKQFLVERETVERKAT